VLTVFRTHPLIHVSYLVALIPGTVLVANGALSVTVLVVYGGVVAFAHSNTNLGFGPLGRVFVSPNYHRIHHMLDGPQDVNLGFAFTIWDQLCGRAVFPTDETIRTATGLPGRPLAVEQAGPRAHHFAVLAAQLVAPFRPMNERTDAPPVRAPRSGASSPQCRAEGRDAPLCLDGSLPSAPRPRELTDGRPRHDLAGGRPARRDPRPIDLESGTAGGVPRAHRTAQPTGQRRGDARRGARARRD
jgi:hypothetical protein